VKLFEARVVANEPVGEGLYMMRAAAPEAAREARAGQFLHVRCVRPGGYDPLLRRPISIYRIEDGQLWMYYDVVGRGTEFLAGLREGDRLDCLGPLGQPFKVPSAAHHLLMVGGGIGLAPLVALAEEAFARELSVTILAGFRSGARALPPRLLPPQAEYVVATEDGAIGYRGYVTDLVPEYLGWADALFACGPTRMLESLQRVTRETTKPIQVSLEERMGCAMGVCLSCVLHTRQGLKRVCRDGPVFELADLRELQWRAA
jgi:dihydroorotate dehydrogenase electron transfer subunit